MDIFPIFVCLILSQYFNSTNFQTGWIFFKLFKKEKKFAETNKKQGNTGTLEFVKHETSTNFFRKLFGVKLKFGVINTIFTEAATGDVL